MLILTAALLLEYRVSGSEIAIGLNSGVLTFVTAPDFETKSSYTVQAVSVTDGKNTTTQDITVTVTDENDNSPVISSGASFMLKMKQQLEPFLQLMLTLRNNIGTSEIAIGYRCSDICYRS